MDETLGSEVTFQPYGACQDTLQLHLGEDPSWGQQTAVIFIFSFKWGLFNIHQVLKWRHFINNVSFLRWWDKTNQFPAWATVSVRFACFSHVFVAFHWGLWFPLTSKDVSIRWPGVPTLSQSEWVWGCVSAPCHGGPLALPPELQGPATQDPGLE